MTAVSIQLFSLSDIPHLICFDPEYLSDSLLLSQTDFSVNYFLIVFLKKEREAVTTVLDGHVHCPIVCAGVGYREGRPKRGKRQ